MIKLISLTCLFIGYIGWTAYCFQDQDDALKESIKRGKTIYTEFCISCHMADGKGIDGTFPPLAEADFLLNNREKSIRAVKYGISGEIKVNGKTYNNTMSDLGLYEDEVADVMNYILNSWGNKSKTMVTEKEVKAVTKTIKEEK